MPRTTSLLALSIAGGGVVLLWWVAFLAAGGWPERPSSDWPEDGPDVEVTARQFWWYFRYRGPDGVYGRTRVELRDEVLSPLGLDPEDPASADDVVIESRVLRLPSESGVRLRLVSLDVVHALWIPALGKRFELWPFESREVWIETGPPRESELACTAYCGAGHTAMRGRLVVLPREELELWERAP